MGFLSKDQRDILILQVGIREAPALIKGALLKCGFKELESHQDPNKISAKVRKPKLYGSVELVLSEKGFAETEVIVNSSARTDNIWAALNDPNKEIFKLIASALGQPSLSSIGQTQDADSVVGQTVPPDSAEVGGQYRKRVRRPQAAMMFGAAVLALGFFYAMTGGRPEASEINISDYDDVCTRARYEDECEGKFIIWDGVVQRVTRDYVRVTFPQVTMDVQEFDGVEPGFVSGQKVKVRGRLADKNFVHPDIEGGEIAALETPLAATDRLAREEAERDREERAREAAAEAAMTPDERRQRNCRILVEGGMGGLLPAECAY